MKTSVYLGCVLVGRHLVTLLLWSVGVLCCAGVVECRAVEWSGVLRSAQLLRSNFIAGQLGWRGWLGERAARLGWARSAVRERTGQASTGQASPGAGEQGYCPIIVLSWTVHSHCHSEQ